MAKNPCTKDCSGRSAECHAICESYRLFRLERDEELKRRNKEQDVQTTHPAKINQIRKKMRWK